MLVVVLVICSTLNSGQSDDMADWTLSLVTSCGILEGAFFWGISLPSPSRPLPDPCYNAKFQDQTGFFYLDSVQIDLQRLVPCLFVVHYLFPSFDELSGTGWAREGM